VPLIESIVQAKGPLRTAAFQDILRVSQGVCEKSQGGWGLVAADSVVWRSPMAFNIAPTQLAFKRDE